VADEQITTTLNPLHRIMESLLYPAFLGAALVAYATFIVGGEDLTLVYIFGLWFILYFCVAYIQLMKIDIDKNSGFKKKYQLPSFILDFLDIVVILVALHVLQNARFAAGHEFYVIYGLVFFIPIIASIQNNIVYRRTLKRLSVLVCTVALCGIIVTYERLELAHYAIVALLYLSLLTYSLVIAKEFEWVPPRWLDGYLRGFSS
jgi:hypothetical protein